MEEQRTGLLAYLVHAQEEERARIAADIHDDPVQTMTAVGMRIETLERRLTDEGDRRLLSQLQDTVNEAIQRMRHLLFELRPPSLEQEELPSLLRTFVSESMPDVEVEIHSDLVRKVPIEMRVVLFRIAQEALSNARKHARARRVTVSLESRRRGALLRIADDGDGFDVGHGSAAGHLGLASMRQRAELAGGWLKIASERGAGTTVEAWVPTTSR